MAKLPKGYKVLRPVHPSAAIRAEYQRRLDALIADMQASYERWVLAAYRANEPAIAQDAAPRRVTAVEGLLRDSSFWNVYVDGVMLRKPDGSGRTFRSQDAAENAGLREGGARAQVTVPVQINDRFSRDALKDLPLAPTPAQAIDQVVADLGVQWSAKIDETAPRLARWFAQASETRSRTQLKKILADSGMTVPFEMTPAMKDIFHATVAENVGLIKSIGSQYHTEVQGMVMRSVAAGRDLGMLTDELTDRYGITRRRAARIALDQNNKSTSDMVRVRQADLGVQAMWLHSAGGKVPRKTHVANSGKIYDPKVGWHDPDPKVDKRIWPGQLINCRCVSRTVVKGFS